MMSCGNAWRTGRAASLRRIGRVTTWRNPVHSILLRREFRTAELDKDYRVMRPMFLNEPPPFETIVKMLSDLEQRIIRWHEQVRFLQRSESNQKSNFLNLAPVRCSTQ